jgi:hypothetical protein
MIPFLPVQDLHLLFQMEATCNNDSTHISAFTSSLNCDSNMITTVFFGSSVMGTYNEVLCSGSSTTYNGITFTSDTIFMDTLYEWFFIWLR